MPEVLFFLSTYNPTNWYWLADDGRVFSSKTTTTIAGTDAAFESWKASGAFPTPWPRDDSGVQTSAALQWVFDNAGLSIKVPTSTQTAAQGTSA